jgi:2-dehydropantoate 2-reductase
MRYVIFGAGAIGGAIGGKLAACGREVVLIARGAHLEALRSRGLELRDPDSTEVMAIPAASSAAEVGLGEGDCILLATKTQQSEGAVADLVSAAGDLAAELPLVCAQNGVENERIALRRLERVYGMRVILAGTHLEPGVVEIATAPVFGILDVGRYPSGEDEVSRQLADDLTVAGFEARSTPEVMGFKYLKLLSNLGNALQAAAAPEPGDGLARAILHAARAEARACYEAAGITLADEEADELRRRLRGGPRPVNGTLRRGGSSWQSLERSTGNIEADYLNGEIVLLGRLHGIETPVNARLQEVANRLARERCPAGSVSLQELSASLATVLATTPDPGGLPA